MDAGISTSENLQWLRDNNYDYITVRRGGSTDDYKLTGSQVVTVEDVRHHPIHLFSSLFWGQKVNCLEISK